MKIIPGILETSFAEIDTCVQSVSEYVDTIQVDICDGQFVPSKTWPYSGMITGRIEQDYQVQQLLQENDGLPEWEKVDYQFDLMIKDPWHTIDTWGRIGASAVILHLAAFPSTTTYLDTCEQARGFLMDVGLAVTYDQYIERKSQIEEILNVEAVRFLQCMTIKNIGVQGQSFDERWLTVLPAIKTQYPNMLIQADGGVHEHSITQLQRVGVDQVVVGSGIFKEGNAGENVEFFNDIVRE